MNKFYTIGTGLIFAVLATFGASGLLNGGNESHPPHTAKAVEIVTCQDDPVACAGYDNIWAVGNAAADQQIAVDAYLAAVEAERIAKEEEAARQAAIAASRSSRQSVGSGSSFNLPSECDGKVIPGYIIQRESGCNYGAVNASGCGGSGCYGMYQIHGMHWSNGGCSDLNWTNPSDQDECASRLSSGGTNLNPWASTR